MDPLRQLIGYALTYVIKDLYPEDCFLLKISDRSVLFSVQDNRLIEGMVIEARLKSLFHELKGLGPLDPSQDSIYTDRYPILEQGVLRYDSYSGLYPSLDPQSLKQIHRLIDSIKSKKKSRCIRFEFSNVPDVTEGFD